MAFRVRYMHLPVDCHLLCLQLKRLLGNGYLSPVLLVKIICNFTIGFELSMVFLQLGIIHLPIDVIKYTDEEYDKYLTDPMWSKEETDQVFELCERTSTCYNVSQEMERKRALSMVLSQTRQQERRDEEVLIEAKRIAELRIPPKVAEVSQLAILL
ncbi:hypothetical protein RJT34_14779 [Clitoria ternatea]|uniref:dAMP1 SANT/Myb-like domain-containing protein n=1 Tax=Clitoria ternatea TaxID=43366 RepID=A0AAN9JTW5_CLITE